MRIKYLNLGGGNFCHRENGWTNLDYEFEYYSSKRDPERYDIKHNLMSPEPLPIENSSVELVYTSHTIEHLTEERVLALFKEAKRILRPRGALRVCVPNSDIFYSYLLNPAIAADYMAKGWLGRHHTASKEYCFIDAVCSFAFGLSDKELWEIIKGFKIKESVYEELYRIAAGKHNFTMEEQAKNPGYHTSWWNWRKLSHYLATAGFRKISAPLKQNESEYDIFHAKYIDRTRPEYTLRVEAVKTEKPVR